MSNSEMNIAKPTLMNKLRNISSESERKRQNEREREGNSYVDTFGNTSKKTPVNSGNSR